MLARSMMIAVMLTAATAASAEPQKAQVQQAAQPSTGRPLVLASAEVMKAPAAATDQQAPAKPARVARVTSCRCGDPVPQEDDSEQ